MIVKENFATIQHLFEDDLFEEIQNVSQIKKVLKGEIMIDLGEQIKYIPLLLDGAIKIVREDASGEELLLYFLEFD